MAAVVVDSPEIDTLVYNPKVLKTMRICAKRRLSVNNLAHVALSPTYFFLLFYSFLLFPPFWSKFLLFPLFFELACPVVVMISALVFSTARHSSQSAGRVRAAGRPREHVPGGRSGRGRQPVPPAQGQPDLQRQGGQLRPSNWFKKLSTQDILAIKLA